MKTTLYIFLLSALCLSCKEENSSSEWQVHGIAFTSGSAVEHLSDTIVFSRLGDGQLILDYRGMVITAQKRTKDRIEFDNIHDAARYARVHKGDPIVVYVNQKPKK